MALSSDQITANNFNDFYGLIKPYLNGGAHAACTPIGTIIAVMGNSAPKNYLVCDGQVVNIASYPELANYFEEQFGTKTKFGGDGVTTFGIPDLRGEFLRGTGTNSHTNQGNGSTVGVHQDGTVETNFWISYSAKKIQAWLGSSSEGVIADNVDKKVEDRSKGVVELTGSNTAYNDSNAARYTSRPTNTSVLYCIAVKNIYVDPQFNYSTDEQVIGSWIDRKPIYQKTISTNISAFSGSGSIRYYDVSSLSIDKPIGIVSGMAKVNTTWFSYPDIELSGTGFNSSYSFSMTLRNSSSNGFILWMQDAVASQISDVIFTIQYTKTTD